MPSYLYIIGPKNGPVKIGISAAPEAVRLPQLQTGHPKKLFLIAQKLGGLEEEAAAHYHLRFSRLEGEWFRRTPEVKTFIELLSGGLTVPMAIRKMDGQREVAFRDWVAYEKERLGNLSNRKTDVSNQVE